MDKQWVIFGLYKWTQACVTCVFNMNAVEIDQNFLACYIHIMEHIGIAHKLIGCTLKYGCRICESFLIHSIVSV
jgi:hypothetical protein